MHTRFLLVFLLIINFSNVFAQEQGYPFIRNFLPAEYGGETQIWSIEQANNGQIYLAGNTGIHIFNGNYWQTTNFPGNNVCRSLHKAENGQIFAGLIGDFGYLEPDKQGNCSFTSLTHLLDSSKTLFSDVWNIKSSGQNIFFHTMETVFVYNLESKKINTLSGTFYYINQANNRVFAQTDKGLAELQFDSLQLINKNLYPWLILPIGNNQAFMLDAKTKQAGIFHLTTFENLSTQYFSEEKAKEIYQKLIQEQAYHSIIFKDSLFLFGTLSSGILVMNKKGDFIEKISEEEGLENKTVMYLFTDQRNQLWAGTSNGVSYIEFSSPIKQWNKSNGITGAIYGSARLNGTLHVLTNLGMYYLRNQKFEPIPELCGENAHQVFYAQEFEIPGKGKIALAASSMGIWEIKNQTAENILPTTLYSLSQSRFNKNYFYYTDENYFVQFEYAESLSADTLYEFQEAVDFLDEWPENTFWFLSTGNIISLNNHNKKITRYTSANQTFISSIIHQQKLYFIAENGVYSLLNDSLVADAQLLGSSYQHSHLRLTILDTINSNEFLLIAKHQNQYRLHQISKRNNTFSTDTFLFNRLPEVDGVYADAENMLLASGTKYVYQIALNKPNFSMVCPIPSIEKIVLNQDSVIQLLANEILNIDYQFNDVSFYFSLPFFDHHETNQFSYQLIGSKQDKWSDWQHDFYKEYTNLNEGEYTFKIRAKNVYNQISEIGTYSFVIKPPYYRTNLAYFIYFLLISLIVWLIIKLYTLKLKRENEQLEDLVKLRTAEIMQQKEEIQAQAENLKELHDAVSLKNAELVMQKEEIQTQAENLQEINTLLSDTNREINEQKEEINKKNEAILSSIQYAKRIQKAVLRLDDDLKQKLPEHFILLKPRDIVSGDFYFIRQVGNLLGIAAVDCTGHGVPGAFMSMLGTAFLTDIVHNKDITTASAILEQLRALVKSSLSQTDKSSTSKDGMDMSIIGINLQTMEAQFAGAHQSLILFRNNELLEWKGDKMPVGFSQKETSFTNYQFKMQKNDVVYLFSDGYYDQFGGENGRKLNKQGLIEILHQIHQKPMKEQQEILVQKHLDWIGDKHKQLDDILVMGFRF